MKNFNGAWQQEIERRAKIYEDLDARNAWEGRMGAADYISLLLLSGLLVVGFWASGN